MLGVSSRFAVCVALALTLAWTEAASGQGTAPDTWEATDGLGRALPTHQVVGDPNDRLVFIFYYMWHQRNGAPQPYDISQIIAGKQQPWADAAWGPSPAFHWWGEPALGYYDVNDEFVIRRHAQLLVDAGVDAIVLDVTNAATYDATWKKICTTYQALRDAGNRTPNITFIAHSSSDATVQHLYEQLYASNECAGLWQMWLGKPVILALPGASLSDAAKAFFTFRESWAWTDKNGWFGDGHDKWPWLDNFPQKFGWHDDATTPEQMPVGVAQHPIGNYGRSHHAGAQEALTADYLSADTANGLGFQEQWDAVLSTRPKVAFVTQWNEWIAQRFVTCGTYDSGATQFLGKPLACGDTHFIDEFNAEFSRDAEPMRGGFGDAYYYQLAANVRRFKGARAAPSASAAKTIAQGDFAAFASVQPEYRDDIGDVTHRNALGFSGPEMYLNDSGRNDFDSLRVARDASTLYFYAHTAAPLSSASDAGWMQLWLDTDGDAKTGYLGFDYVVNRARNASGAAIERYAGSGFSWTNVGTAALSSSANELVLSVPRASLQLPASSAALSFRFKWSDNLPAQPQAADLLDQGDVAPNGRFMYRYVAAVDIDAMGGAGGATGTSGAASAEAGAAGAPVANSGGAAGANEVASAGSGGSRPSTTAGAPAIAGANAAPMPGHASGCSCSFGGRETTPRAAACLLLLLALAAYRRRVRSSWPVLPLVALGIGCSNGSAASAEHVGSSGAPSAGAATVNAGGAASDGVPSGGAPSVGGTSGTTSTDAPDGGSAVAGAAPSAGASAGGAPGLPFDPPPAAFGNLDLHPQKLGFYMVPDLDPAYRASAPAPAEATGKWCAWTATQASLNKLAQLLPEAWIRWDNETGHNTSSTENVQAFVTCAENADVGMVVSADATDGYNNYWANQYVTGTAAPNRSLTDIANGPYLVFAHQLLLQHANVKLIETMNEADGPWFVTDGDDSNAFDYYMSKLSLAMGAERGKILGPAAAIKQSNLWKNYAARTDLPYFSYHTYAGWQSLEDVPGRKVHVTEYGGFDLDPGAVLTDLWHAEQSGKLSGSIERLYYHQITDDGTNRGGFNHAELEGDHFAFRDWFRALILYGALGRIAPRGYIQSDSADFVASDDGKGSFGALLWNDSGMLESAATRSVPNASLVQTSALYAVRVLQGESKTAECRNFAEQSWVTLSLSAHAATLKINELPAHAALLVTTAPCADLAD